MTIKIDEEGINNTPMISVIVPAYNEEGTIGEVLSRLLYLKNKMLMEIIVVDDGSRDNTVAIVKRYPSIKLIQHEKNYGKGSSIKTGLSKCSGNIIVIQDSDLEYLPEHIPELVKPFLEANADVVYGSRFIGKIKGMKFSHMIGNRILSFVTQFLYNKKITDVMTGYKVFSKKVLEEIDITENGFEVEVEITSKILQNDFKLIEVPISYEYRKTGNSKITYWHGFTCLIKLFWFKIFS